MYHNECIATIRFDENSTYKHFRVNVETRARFENGELSSVRSYDGADVTFSGQCDDETPHWYAIRLESNIQSDYWQRLADSVGLIKKWRKATENDADIAILFFKLCKIAKVKNVLIVVSTAGKKCLLRKLCLFSQEKPRRCFRR